MAHGVVCFNVCSPFLAHTHTHGTHNKTEDRHTTAERRTVSASSGYISMSTKVKSNTAARRGELPLHIHEPYGELLELRCVSGITFSLIRGGFKTSQTKPCILDTITILAKHLQYHKINQLSIGRLVC